MADDRLDSFVTDAGKKELQDVEASLQRSLDRIKEINKNSIRFEGATAASDSIKGLKDNTDKLRKSQDEFSASLNEYIKQAQELERLNAKLAISQSEQAKQTAAAKIAIREHTRAMREQAEAENETVQNRLLANKMAKEAERQSALNKKAALEEAKQLERLTNEYLLLTDAYADAKAKAQQLGAAFGVNSKVFQDQAKIANDLHKRLSEIDKAVGDNRRNVGNYASAWNGLGNSITQVLRELPNFAQNVQIGFMAISNNLPILADELKKARLANAALAADGKATVPIWKQVSSSIFNWQTGLLAIITIAMKWKDIIKLFSPSQKIFEDIKKSLDEYKKSLDSITESSRKHAYEEKANADILYKTATDARLAMEVRISAVKELQKLYPNYLGNLSREAILTGKAADEFSRLSEAIFYNAAAKSAEKKAASAVDTYYESYDKERAALTSTNQALDKYNKAREAYLKKYPNADLNNLPIGEQENNLVSLYNRYKNLKGISDVFGDLKNKAFSDYQAFLSDAKKFANEAAKTVPGNQTEEKSIDGLRKKIADLTDQRDKLNYTTAEYIKLDKEIVRLQKILDDLTHKRRGKEKITDTTSDELSAAKRLAEAQAKLRDQQIQQDIEANKQIYEDETKNLSDRLLAYENYQSDRIYQADIAAKKEKEILQSQLTAIDEIRGKAVGKRSPAEKKLLEQEQGIRTELQAIEEKHQADIAEINRQGNEFLLKIEKEYHAKILKAVSDQEDQAKVAYTANYAYQKSLLDKKLGDQEITEARYRRSLQKLDRETQTAAINGQIAFLQNQQFFLKQLGLNTDEITKEITKLQNTANTLKSPAPDTNALKGFGVTDEDLGDLQEYIKTAQHGMEIFKGFADVGKQLSDRRIASYDAEIDAIKRRTETEIDGINASGASDEQKKKKIAELNAKEAAQEEAINAKKLQAKRKQAAIDKAINIANIISTTALAVVTTLSDKTIVPGFARIPLAALIGALGAAQLAVAISTPLPEFAKGTDHAPEGWAVTGEKGREIKITPDGDVSLTKDHANIEYLKGGTKIISADKTAEILKYIAIQQLPLLQKQPRYNNDDVVAELKDVKSGIVQAINKKQFKADSNFNWALYNNVKTGGDC